jgi:signal transduction histidine kinase
VRLHSLLRTTGFRFALLYSGLFGASVLVLFGVVYWNTAGHMERQLKDVIDAEVQALQGDYREGGLTDLRRSVEDRIASDKHPWTLYLLQDRHGGLIAGNIAPRTPATGWQESVHPLHTGEEADDHLILGQGVMFPGGVYLFVAQDAYQLDRIRDLMIGAFGWAFLAVVVLAVGGGLVMSASLLGRVEGVNRTAQDIVRGAMSRRIPTRGTGDEFDRLAANLNRMLDRIESLMEGLRQVSNDIAHDLRTPLGRLRQRLEEAQRTAHSAEDYAGAVNQAIADADAILETFAALLRIAQVESGSRRSRFADVDLAQLAQTVVETYVPVAEDSRHLLVSAIEPCPPIRGDRELLMQLFANLIENALCHTPAGAEVRFSLRCVSAGPLVEIADHGPGIPEADRQKVFERFYRRDASRGTPGSGLGLALAAAIAELHDVRIALSDNAPGLRVTMQFSAGS